MAISRELLVTLNGTSASMEDLYIYERDRGIDLYFTIKESKFIYKKDTVLQNVENDTNVDVTVIKPNGIEILIRGLTVIDGKIKFKVTSDLTDELTEIGDYKLQFHIGNGSTEEFSIPEIKFKVIARIKGIRNPYTDSGMVDYSEVYTETDLVEYVEPPAGKYVKHIWETNEVLTAAKLNNMEDGIDKHQKSIDKINTQLGQINNLTSQIELLKSQLGEMSQTIDTINGEVI